MRAFRGMRQRSARRRYMPKPPRGRRTTFAVALLAVIVLGSVALLIDRGTRDRYADLLESFDDPPAPLRPLIAAGRSHRLLILSDGGETTSAMRLAADVVGGIARGVGLDALVLPIASDRQDLVDAFLAGGDGSRLFADAPGRPLWSLLRQIRELNRELGAARSVRVVAADVPGWPPPAGLPPARLVERWNTRDEYMARIVDERVLAREPRARIVIVVDGLSALRSGFTVRTGGVAPVVVLPLGARLADRSPREVWSVLVDGPPAGTTPRVASLSGTNAWTSAGDAGLGDFIVNVTPAFGAADDWLRVTTSPGVTVSGPEGRLSDVVDAWARLAR